MSKEFYMPKGDKEKRAWHNNFDTELASVGAGLGILPAEIADVHKDNLALNYILDNLETFKAETKERTSYKDLLFDGEIRTPLGALPGLPTLPVAPAAVPAGVFKRTAKIVQRIKNHPNYNDALGKSLGIIGTEKVIDFENAKVRITLRSTDSDGVALNFVIGNFDGVVVYAGSYAHKITDATKLGETTIEEPVMIWTELGRAASSPFIDTRLNESNKPETRHYKIRYLKKQIPVGKDSDIISVVATVYKAGAELANKVK